MTSLSAGRVARGALPASLPDRILAVAERGHGHACALLLALCLVCFLPGLTSLQPMDRDEPRFAQASKQMLETGDLVDIRFQAEARHKKPVGIYWLQAACVAAGEALGVPGARTAIGLYRLPSLFGAAASVLLAYWAALAFLARRGAFLAAALYGACLMLAAEAHLAKTDAVLAACATASFGALARAWLRRDGAGLGRGAFLAFWLGLALGILVKGPMVPMFVGFAALVLGWRARSGRWLLALRPGPGLLLALLIVAPWFLAIAWKSGGAFFGASVGQDMLGKVGGAKEKHWGPPGAYAVAFFATFWPGAPFAALSLPFAWRERGSDAVAFLLAWIVPSWLAFEAVPTKLPHYVLPLMPAVAILTALALERGALDATRRGARITASVLLVLIPAGLTLGLLAAGWKLGRTLPLAALPPLLGACALAALAAATLLRREPARQDPTRGETARHGLPPGAAARACVGAILAACLLTPAVLGLAQRALPALKVSGRLAAIRDGLPCPDPRVASLGYREPSLVFLIGTDLAMLDSGAQALDFLRAGGCRLVFVEARFAADLAAAAPVAAPLPAPAGQVSGFNINGGKRLDLTAYAVVP
ncbi:ArnT family glycosyltransferase [Methylobacterium oxalidis]|uniref:Glycosyl transferase n=1 Tax=Methylobacterium oxalidis TaxID=944322 RepID=A0A512J0Z9_9HYPH|nr:glycosyltransferase family 39 protein [Methylobacterium oxalidis]GEP03648.1 glycosyl transferase [Methylobacterium oxalidis]GJE34355.1 Undecaprenyl phosphate-alpha-4-amino-4-deoxy-L-arabinose arabinosyl transferase [Methylobacterium oxalidis]GLS64975.1 glycosyl transferase [Methylobacterium oxalidis]